MNEREWERERAHACTLRAASALRTYRRAMAARASAWNSVAQSRSPVSRAWATWRRCAVCTRRAAERSAAYRLTQSRRRVAVCSRRALVARSFERALSMTSSAPARKKTFVRPSTYRAAEVTSPPTSSLPPPAKGVVPSVTSTATAVGGSSSARRGATFSRAASRPPPSPPPAAIPPPPPPAAIPPPPPPPLSSAKRARQASMGIRVGKARRAMRMASSTPADRSCDATCDASKRSCPPEALGLMQRQ